jgi:hypothetical protein
MLWIVRCQNCDGNPCADEAMSVEVKVEVHKEKCDSCHHRDISDRTFHFCGISCLTEYLQKHGGFPCDGCHGSGWAWGIESNGVCKKCLGSKLQPSGKAPPRGPNDP